MKKFFLLFFLANVTCYMLHVTNAYALEMKSSQYKMFIQSIPQIVETSDKLPEMASILKKNGYVVTSSHQSVELNISDTTISLQKNGAVLLGSTTARAHIGSETLPLFIEKTDNTTIKLTQNNKNDAFYTLTFTIPIEEDSSIPPQSTIQLRVGK